MQATIATPSASAPVIFNFTEQAVRIVADDHDNPWFAAKDVCNILGYVNDTDAIKKHCKEKGVAKRDTPTSGGIQSLTFINEGNLYRLIFGSTKTGKTVGTYANAQTARAARDRLDLRYGAIRYRVVMPSVPARTTVDALTVQVERTLDQPNVTQ